MVPAAPHRQHHLVPEGAGLPQRVLAVEGRAGLTFGDESFGPLTAAAANGQERAIAGVANGVPVFAGDSRRPENSKAAKPSRHS